MASRKRSLSNAADNSALHKEWDDASCPICMDHPHNAVLLLCSSYDKGCRAYICDTSYRHSNCLDRFKKLRSDNKNSPSPPRLSPRNQQRSFSHSDRNLGFRTTTNSSEAHGHGPTHGHGRIRSDASDSIESSGGPSVNTFRTTSRHYDMQDLNLEIGGSERVDHAEMNDGNSSDAISSLRCPLCRGSVLGWEVVEEARKYLNSKSRSCSRESCSFIGSYRELRRHARREHPSARPCDVDPSRERAWMHLEHQRDYGDIVSAIRSAMPGAVVLGDYVIENADRASGERGRGSGARDRPWFTTTFLLFQMLGSMDRAAERSAGRSRVSSTRPRRSTGTVPGRRFLWGQNLLGGHDDDDNDEDDVDVNILSDTNEDASPVPRRRRRLTRYRSDEDQS